MHDIHGRPTIAEVSLAALRTNCRRAQALVGPGVAVMAVVKADGYGHGAVAAARAFVEAGAAALGVSSVEEAVELRRGKVKAPVVVLGGTFPGQEKEVVQHDLATAVWSLDAARALAAAAKKAKRTVAVHLKLNTGMTRLGVEPADAPRVATALGEIAGLRVDGLFSHLASADAVDTASARAQIARFADAVRAVAAAGVRPPFVHLANSAAVIAAPEAHFTMVRPGIMLYGCAPAAHLAERAQVRPALRLRSAVAQVRRVPAGTPVGYGATFVTARPSAIATVPIGYADGYHRLNSNRASMIVGGRRVPVAGRICMDHTMLDVTDAGAVEAGDPVIAIGASGGVAVPADEVAGCCETISYEVLTSIGRRVPRVYVEEFDG